MSESKTGQTEEYHQQLTEYRSRIGDIEADVGNLKTEVAKGTLSIEGMRADFGVMRTDMSRLFTKMDQVITGTSSVTANKGMVQWSTVAWGIGLLVSMAGLGITITVIAAGLILWAVDTGDERSNDRMDHIVKLEDSRHEIIKKEFNHVWDDVSENRVLSLGTDERVRAREINSFTKEEGLSLRDRLASLETDAARNDERIKKTWDEITDHEDELDHPIRQTYKMEGLEKRIDELTGKQ